MDIDGTILLGREPAERVRGVNRGDGTEREGKSHLQKLEFYCKEKDQHNGNANEYIPSAYRLPLEGEWTGCASGEASDPKVDGIKLEGCEGVTSVRECVDKMDTLIVLSIKSESTGSDGIPRMHLRGTHWCMGDTNRPGY